MAVFDLERFRDLAFGGGSRPDHPLGTVAEASTLLADLDPAAPAETLAELTAWTKSMNETDSFTPVRRVRILLMLDDATQPIWRALDLAYLAPYGKPLARDGERDILRAMFDSASEFTNGFGIALDASDQDDSVWLEKNVSRVYVRNMRWLARRLVLAHMLHLAVGGAIWERMHRLFRLAEERKVSRAVLPVFRSKRPTSVRHEYIRALLLDLAAPDSMPARQVELAFRITRRVADAVKLEEKPTSSTPFAVVPAGDARPTVVQMLDRKPSSPPLYIDTALALPKLRAGLERDAGRNPLDPDPLYNNEFTIGERLTMLERLLEHWGMDAPRRRTRRISLQSVARVISGFEHVVGVLPSFNEKAASAKRVDLQLKIDETTQTLRRSQIRAAARVGPARVIDASTGGLGLAVRRGDARWAVHGALVAVRIEPGTDWVVGVVRRILAFDEELRLGVQVLSTRPCVVSLGADSTVRDSVWEDAIRFESSFDERYKKGIVLDPGNAPPAAGELLLEPRLVSKGTQFDLPLPTGTRRLRVTRVFHSGEHFQRIFYEALN